MLANLSYSEDKSYKGIGTGFKFNQLTVLRNVYRNDVKTRNENYWECLCECGNKTTVLDSNLTRGRVRSCGCLRGIKKGTKTINDYPELDISKGVLVEDGLFLVFENEQIFRVNGKSLIETSKFKTSRGYRYKSVTATVDGKQKHYYVHRLMAEAFIPNTENKPQVNHIDGNPLNNHITNLEWVTASENVQHAVDNGFTETLSNTSRKCGLCGSPSMAKGVCGDCKQTMVITKNRLKAKRSAKESVRFIDLSVLTSKQQEIMTLRKKGYGLEEIGRITNTSRQNVEQTINYSIERFNKNKSICGKLGIKSIRNVTKTEIKRINYLRKKLIELEKELKDLIS